MLLFCVFPIYLLFYINDMTREVKGTINIEFWCTNFSLQMDKSTDVTGLEVY